MGEPDPDTLETDYESGATKLVKIVIGLTLFFVSLVLLWRNEGQVDIPGLIRQSRPASTEAIDRTAGDELVSVTGGVKSKQLLGDPGFLKFGPFITLNRKVEMYAWVEQFTVEVQKTLGGRKERTTGFSYQKEWTERPPDSDLFSESAGHENPPLPLESFTYTVHEATIGAYKFFPQSADMPSTSPLSITSKDYVPSLETKLRGDYINIGKGDVKNPRVGDVRISYSALRAGAMVTLFGKLNDESVQPYLHGENARIYRLFAGSREDALSQLPASSTAAKWILRLAGLLIMWGGLSLCFAPLNARFKLIPALEDIGQLKTGGMLLAAATLLTLLTLLVAVRIGNMVVLGIALTATCIAVWFFAGKRFASVSATSLTPSRQRPSTPAQPTRAPSTPPAGTSREKRSTLPLHDAQVRQSTDPSDSEESELPSEPRPKKQFRKEIRIACEACGLGYTVPASYQGRKVRCHKCGHKFYIPLGSADGDSDPTVLDTSS